MVELRTLPSVNAPNGKLDGTWDPKTNSITVYNPHLKVFTTYDLHLETESVTVEERKVA